MGILNFIQKNLPESWDKISRKYGKKGELCRRIYDKVPKKFRNKYHYKDGIAVAKRLMRADSILQSISYDPPLNGELYKKMDVEIKEYEYLCK